MQQHISDTLNRISAAVIYYGVPAESLKKIICNTMLIEGLNLPNHLSAN